MGVLILPILVHLRCLVVVGFGVEYRVLLVEDFGTVAIDTQFVIGCVPRRGGVKVCSGGEVAVHVHSCSNVTL